MVEVCLFRKSKTPEEKEIKLVLGFCILLTIILGFIFSNLIKKIQGNNLLADVSLIIFIVTLPVCFFAIYYWIRGKRNG